MLRPSELVLFLVTLTLLQGCQGHAKTFDRCQLTRELLRYNFPRNLMQHWICMVEHANSGRSTEKITNHNNSYTSYGLFQINNKDWCRKGKKGGHCNIKCEDLLNEDLSDDVRCARRIYDTVGFKGWPVSYAYCKSKKLPDLSRC